MKKIFILIFLLSHFFIEKAVIARQFFVKIDATGPNTGVNWAAAFTNLQSALGVAQNGDIIWVAKGVYKPSASDRNISFAIPNGVKIYGGFAGNEIALEHRNWAINKTILSGNIGNPSDSLDNSYNVVYFYNASTAPLLDGFTIQEGAGNRGGGILVTNGFNGQPSSAIIANCIITRNFTATLGGGICTFSLYYPTQITLINTAIYGNGAPRGGAISNLAGNGSASVKMINCTIAKNTASVKGGGIFNYSTNVSALARDSIFNSIIWENIAPASQSIENEGVGAKAEAFYSNIQGINADENRSLISINPQFTNPTIHDYTPNPCGRSVDRGNSPYLINNYTVLPLIDILGNNRIKKTLDMGAYECASSTQYVDELPQIYVNKNANGKNDGSSWTDAFTDLFYLQETGCIYSKTIWIASGTYRPSQTNDRTVSFELKDQLKVYGGFAGNESTLESRNWATNPTIITGNIGNQNTSEDNTYHIFTIKGNKALIDGLIIQDGNTKGIVSDINYEAPSGGGILVAGGQDTTELIVRNCIIRNNESWYAGGGIAHITVRSAPSRLRVYGTLFVDNKSAQGGAVSHCSSASYTDTLFHSTHLINCTISKNMSDLYGSGGLYYATFGKKLKSEFKIYNSIIWDNPSLFNPQIETIGFISGLAIANTTIQNNQFTGTNVLAVDPQFNTNAFTLKESSPCRNIGDNALATLAGLTKDLGFNDRLANLKIDLGAYEGNQICLSNQNLSQTFNNGLLTVQDGSVLTSTSKVIPTSNTTFDAKSAIVLQPGFMAGGNGVVFTAQIGGCN
ncbi:3-coathanger stack domain-containing protein [Emticicia sp. C21]|uniref:3-coathanger stack domain-containing protein n=1 Tax=Emticicia sp. C21 TaxID=2302915 RepID=UPI000E3433A4|nr:3-coathanger stack domain-containing protein [Emticicia sp. C21]RFS15423.1 hypothetical protein D0T08_14820 [Emticicia sp. C21]